MSEWEQAQDEAMTLGPTPADTWADVAERDADWDDEMSDEDYGQPDPESEEPDDNAWMVGLDRYERYLDDLGGRR